MSARTIAIAAWRSVPNRNASGTNPSVMAGWSMVAITLQAPVHPLIQ